MMRIKDLCAMLVLGALMLTMLPAQAAVADASNGVVLADGSAVGNRVVVVRIDQVTGDPVVAQLRLEDIPYPSAMTFLVPTPAGDRLQHSQSYTFGPHSYEPGARLALQVGPASVHMEQGTQTVASDSGGVATASTPRPGDSGWAAWSAFSGTEYLAIAFASPLGTAGAWTWHATSALGLSRVTVVSGEAVNWNMRDLAGPANVGAYAPAAPLPDNHFSVGFAAVALGTMTYHAAHSSSGAIADTGFATAPSLRLDSPTKSIMCEPCGPLLLVGTDGGSGDYRVTVSAMVGGPAASDLSFLAWSVDMP